MKYSLLLIVGMLQVQINYGLDTAWTNSIGGMNCTLFLHVSPGTSIESREIVAATGTEDTAYAVSTQYTGCPPWHYTQE